MQKRSEQMRLKIGDLEIFLCSIKHYLSKDTHSFFCRICWHNKRVKFFKKLRKKSVPFISRVWNWFETRSKPALSQHHLLRNIFSCCCFHLFCTKLVLKPLQQLANFTHSPCVCLNIYTLMLLLLFGFSTTLWTLKWSNLFKCSKSL